MSVKKFYWPVDRVLEDYREGTQIKFAKRPGDDETFKLLDSKIGRKKVKVKIDGKVIEQVRWVSLYEVTLGNREPFKAGIIANHVDVRAGAYRLLNDTDVILDIIFDD